MCPLTIWEDALRGTSSEKGFIARWIHAWLFWDWPPWVFTRSTLRSARRWRSRGGVSPAKTRPVKALTRPSRRRGWRRRSRLAPQNSRQRPRAPPRRPASEAAFASEQSPLFTHALYQVRLPRIAQSMPSSQPASIHARCSAMRRRVRIERGGVAFVAPRPEADVGHAGAERPRSGGDRRTRRSSAGAGDARPLMPPSAGRCDTPLRRGPGSREAGRAGAASRQAARAGLETAATGRSRSGGLHGASRRTRRMRPSGGELLLGADHAEADHLRAAKERGLREPEVRHAAGLGGPLVERRERPRPRDSAAPRCRWHRLATMCPPLPASPPEGEAPVRPRR